MVKQARWHTVFFLLTGFYFDSIHIIIWHLIRWKSWLDTHRECVVRKAEIKSERGRVNGPVWSVAGFIKGRLRKREFVWLYSFMRKILAQPWALLWKGQGPSQRFTITSSHLCKQMSHTAHTQAHKDLLTHALTPLTPHYRTFLFSCTYTSKLKSIRILIQLNERCRGDFIAFNLEKPCGVCDCDIKHPCVCCGYIDKCERFSHCVSSSV